MFSGVFSKTVKWNFSLERLCTSVLDQLNISMMFNIKGRLELREKLKCSQTAARQRSVSACVVQWGDIKGQIDG